MKYRKLDSRGVAHHFLLALAVVGIITAFTFQAVAGHAEELKSATASSATDKKKDITDSTLCKSKRPTLKYPQRSSCVALLQSKIGGNLTVDGKFGKTTQSRVKAVQKANNLKVDGVVGKCTWRAIYRETMPAGCLASNAAKQGSPLVYCTYETANHVIVPNAHISAAACKQHKGIASSKPVPLNHSIDDSNMVQTPVL